MGTRCEIVIVGINTELAERTFLVLKSETEQLENLMSRFIPGSALTELNKGTTGQWLTIPDELWDILIVCRDFYEKSAGVFDVTAGPLIDLWKNKPDDYNPSAREIESVKAISGFDKLEFDKDSKKILKKVDGLGFDLGAVGKGIALDRMKKRLNESAIKQAFISFGESSVMALGAHPAGPYWPVGIPNAFNREEMMHVFNAFNEVVTTSGTVFNSSFHPASIRRHIVNPLTGMPVKEMKMVSVKSTSGAFGEFLSTTLLILEEEVKMDFLSKIKNVEILGVNYQSIDEIKKEFIIL